MAEGEERPGGGGDKKKLKLPVGFRFKPTDEELLEFYLLPKLQGKPTVRDDAIIEANVYECEPEVLINGKYKDRGENAWYFLSPRTRKYPGGSRPSRRTADGNGRWKPSTGQSEAEAEQEQAVKTLGKGKISYCENTLAYHRGPANSETKWLMHELTVPEYKIKPGHGTLLDRYVACTIYVSPLKKWNKDDEEGSTSSEGEQASPTAPSPSNRQAVKRPAEGRSNGHATAPKRAAQPSLTPRPAPRPMNGGGMQAPLGAGAAGYHGVPGQAPRPPWMYNRLQAPVQLSPLMYDHNGRAPMMTPYSGQAPAQGSPGLMQFPPPQANAASPYSFGRAMVMRPPNLAGGQPVRPPSAPNPNSPGRAMAMRPTSLPGGQPSRLTSTPNSIGRAMVMRPPGIAGGQSIRPPSALPPPRQQKQEMDAVNTHRVYARMIEEFRAHEDKLSASRAAQQQTPAAPTPPEQPCFDAGVNHPARAMVPGPQFSAPHDCYPSKGGHSQQHQQLFSSVITTASVAGGAAAPAEATPASGMELSKVSLAGDGTEGSFKGDAATMDTRQQPFADLAAMKD
ncbi:hypothetical protein ACP70R_011179 [Stipagrostis hirtigluma subsp. patula]